MEFLDPPRPDQITDALCLLLLLGALQLNCQAAAKPAAAAISDQQGGEAGRATDGIAAETCGCDDRDNNPEGQITAVGRAMAELPLDPTLSRALVAAASTTPACLDATAAICSMLSCGDFQGPGPSRKRGREIDSDHRIRNRESGMAEFSHPQGDHLTYLKIFKAFQGVRGRERLARAEWLTPQPPRG